MNMGLIVGFDLDMTLVDSRPGIRASMKRSPGDRRLIDVEVVLGRLGPSSNRTSGSQPTRSTCSPTVPRGSTGTTASATAHLLPGARASVDAVRARDGQVVVVTAKVAQAALRCLATVDIEADAVVGHVHGDEKRDALRDHGVGIYVGDTVADVRAALDAAALAVGVTTGPDDARRLVGAGADVVLDSLAEFPAWLATVT
jgi:phosphoglycolate phosphatase